MTSSGKDGTRRPAPLIRRHLPWLVVMALIWTGMLASLLAWEISGERARILALASHEAQAYFNKDKAFRLWATSHGGVYVPADERTPPNPHLSHVPERDLTTPSGRSLTLMNPAYMLRQLMNDYAMQYGVKGKITSFPDKLLNPENMPDAWELAALESFREGADEVKEAVAINGEPYFRLMQPLFIEQGCLKCHAFQGYKPGELRGGVSVSVPIASYQESERQSVFRLYVIGAFLWIIGLVALVAFSQLVARKQAIEDHIQLNRELERLSSVDGLTEIANRRTFDTVLEREWRRAQRSGKPLSLMMVDIDFFKLFNDRYGHQRGDECLRQVARVLAESSRRATDLVARYGGEEFALLLPETEAGTAVTLAEACRVRLIQQQITFETAVSDVVTISLGVASCVPAAGVSPAALVMAADTALYHAKESGRNRVALADAFTGSAERPGPDAA